MVKGLIGRKIEMTQVFDKHGRVVPVTKIKVETNFVVQIKNSAKDGYKAVQLATGKKKNKVKPELGHAKKAGLEFLPRIVREFEYDGDLKVGDSLVIDQVYRKGSLVDVVGESKGKGFAGVVKRWGFAGGPRTHGQSDKERSSGSIGAGTTPGRVLKGKKMAGHLGSSRVTVSGLEIIDLVKDENEIWVSGSVPGARGTYLLIKKSLIKKRAYREPEIPETPVVTNTKEDGDEKDESSEKQEEVGEDKKPESEESGE